MAANLGPRASALEAIAAYFSQIEGLTGVRGWPEFSPAQRACIKVGKGLAAVVFVSEERTNVAPKLIGQVNEGGALSVQTYRTGWLRITARLEVWAATKHDRDRFECAVEEAAAPDIPADSVAISLVSTGYHDRPLDVSVEAGEPIDGSDSAGRGEYRFAFELDVSTDLVKVKRGPGTARQLSTTAQVTTTEHGVDVVESDTVTP